MKEHYHASNMLLSVAGNITHDEVIDLANQHFFSSKNVNTKRY